MLLCLKNMPKVSSNRPSNVSISSSTPDPPYQPPTTKRRSHIPLQTYSRPNETPFFQFLAKTMTERVLPVRNVGIGVECIVDSRMHTHVFRFLKDCRISKLTHFSYCSDIDWQTWPYRRVIAVNARKGRTIKILLLSTYNNHSVF